MENKQYRVVRDNVFVGKVVKASHIHVKKVNVPYDIVKKDCLYASGYKTYRSMLFVPNQDLLSDDLLFCTPNYPILNVTKNLDSLEFLDKPIINEAINIGDLLKYFGYGEELTYWDILKIRKTFFNYSFIKDNCELFGYKKDLDGFDRKKFEFVCKPLLDPRYFQALSLNSDKTIDDLLKGYCDTTDSFRPHKDEVLVRKLTL